VNSRQQVLSGVQDPPKRRVSASDLFLGLFLLAFVGLGIVVSIRGLVTERRSPQSETPGYVTLAPPQVFYNSADREKLNSEIAGCVLTLVVLAIGCWRLRRRPPEPRLAPLPDAVPRPVQAVVRPTWHQPPRRAGSASIAAERLSTVVWTDQLARREAKSA
jgi:hypothetical protein